MSQYCTILVLQLYNISHKGKEDPDSNVCCLAGYLFTGKATGVNPEDGLGQVAVDQGVEWVVQ